MRSIHADYCNRNHFHNEQIFIGLTSCTMIYFQKYPLQTKCFRIVPSERYHVKEVFQTKYSSWIGNLKAKKTELIQKAYFICFDFEHILLKHSWIFTSKLVNGCLSDQHNVKSTLSTDEHILLTNTILFLMIHNKSNSTKFLLRNSFFVLKGVWNDRFDFEIIKLFQSVSGVKSFTHQI